MQFTAVNPTRWAEGMFDQGRVITGQPRTLVTAGQVAVVEDSASPIGVSPAHPGEFRPQFVAALDAVDQVIQEAGMTRDDIQHMKFYVTDMEAAMANLDVMFEWLGDNRPPQALIGVKDLAMPGLVVEIEAAAMAAS